jgi:tetratricopeptide (TPR) repeat protein
MKIDFTARIFLCLLCLLQWPLETLAGTLEDKAQSFFNEKRYKESLDIWYEMAASGQATAGLYYNIGLAESALKDTPGAMIAFEKAKRLNPLNTTIKEAILKERENIENATIPVRPFFLLTWYRGFLALLRPGYWTFLGLLILIFAVARFIHRYIHAPDRNFQPSGTDIFLVFTGGVMLFIGFLSYTSLYRDDEAILHIPCELKQAPSEESPSTATVYPGEKVVICDQLTGWYFLKMLNMEEGWIRMECVTRIQMASP